MNWSQARRRLLQLATGRRPASGRRAWPSPAGALVAGGPGSAAPAGTWSAVLAAGRASERPAPTGRDAVDRERRRDSLPRLPRTAAEADREAEPRALAAASGPAGSADAPAAAISLCIASGKGGTGKSVVTASLASLFSRDERTLIVDADMGVGNAHLLQDVSPTKSFVDVVEGRCSVKDVLVPCGERIDLVSAGSGVPRMAELSSYELHLIASGLAEIEADYRFELVDSAAGISRQTVAFAKASDAVLVVTTPDLTAMTDAYAFLKVLFSRRPELDPWVLVNRASGEEEAAEVAGRIERVCSRFLQRSTRCIGWVPEDPVVTHCANRRGPVVLLEPHAPFSYALRQVAVTLRGELAGLAPRGLGQGLLREAGYSRRLA